MIETIYFHIKKSGFSQKKVWIFFSSVKCKVLGPVKLVHVKSDFPGLAAEQWSKLLLISLLTYLSVYCSFDCCWLWHLHQIVSNYGVVSVTWVTGDTRTVSSKEIMPLLCTSAPVSYHWWSVYFLGFLSVCKSCSKCDGRSWNLSHFVNSSENT